MQQIYDALIEDHRKVRELLADLVNLDEDTSAEARHRLIEQIRDELIPHARAEEAVFYNSIRAVNTAQDLVWHGYEEHMQAEAILRALQAADKVNAKWKALARKLEESINHHVREEEEHIIPTARQLFTEEEAEGMANAFEEIKPQVKESGMVRTTLDLIANMLPPRLAAPLRTYTFRV